MICCINVDLKKNMVCEKKCLFSESTMSDLIGDLSWADNLQDPDPELENVSERAVLRVDNGTVTIVIVCVVGVLFLGCIIKM